MKYIKYIIILGVIVLASVSSYAYYLHINTKPKEVSLEQKKAAQHTAIRKSLLSDKPEALQNIFKESVAKKEKNSLSKSSAYFIAHRYFDNGGDIYEIVDFVNNNPEVSFLKEASKIYPKLFKKVNGRLELTSAEKNFVYLAYLEELNNEGYASLGLWCSAASLYLGTYNISKKEGKLKSLDLYKNKGLVFLNLANKNLQLILSNSKDVDIEAQEKVAGLNQCAVAISYLNRNNIVSDIRINEIDLINKSMSIVNSDDQVKSLKIFTAMNANYVLFLTGKQSTSTIQNISLGKIINTSVLGGYRIKPNDAVDKMISPNASIYNSESIFGSKFISSIAKYDIELNNFLKSRNFSFTK